MITSAHSKSSKSSGFNPILQKLYEMICQIILSKTVGRILVIFCRSSFNNNFMVKKNFLELKNRQNWNISRPIYFKKNSTHRFVGLICTNTLEGFFYSKKPLLQDLQLFSRLEKPLIWPSFFSTKNLFYIFLRLIIWF